MRQLAFGVHSASRLSVETARKRDCTILIGNKEYDVKVLPSNSQYRLGDLWYHKGDRPNRLRNLEDTADIIAYHNHTLLHCYLKHGQYGPSHRYNGGNATLLRECCQKRKALYPMFSSEDVVLHLRAGDKGYLRANTSTLQQIESRIGALNVTGKVHIITVLNFSPFINNSTRRYLYHPKSAKRACTEVGNVARNLMARGYQVSIQSNRDIDIDVCTMALHARRFVHSYGGLSSLMKCASAANASILQRTGALISTEWCDRNTRCSVNQQHRVNVCS